MEEYPRFAATVSPQSGGSVAAHDNGGGTVTLRQRLGADVRRIHEHLDELLDSEDAILVLADRQRAIHFARGFGLSACQHELLAVEIDRAIRTVTRFNFSEVGRASAEREKSSRAA